MPVTMIDDHRLAAEAAREELAHRSIVRRLARACEHAQAGLWTSPGGLECLTPDQAVMLVKAQGSLDALAAALAGEGARERGWTPPEAA